MTSSSTRTSRLSTRVLAEGRYALLIIVVSLALGGATSFGQGILPDAIRPIANSASGWTVLTALLVWSVRRPVGVSAVLGGLSFVSLVLGYTAASNLRGYPFSPLFWSGVGIVTGPVVGAAAAALHRRGWWPAVGVGVLAGIMAGEAFYGMRVVVATTGWLYWVLVAALGVGLLVVVAARRLRTGRLIILAAGTAAAVTLMLNLGYALANAGLIPIT